MQYRSNGAWAQGNPKIRRNGQWVSLGSTGGDGGESPDGGGVGRVSDAGFGWDQTFTDTSWVTDAGDDLNVERVTTLSPTGSGSISEAIDNAAGQPTVVVFEVGGVIDNRGNDLRVRSSELWIAGETAPDPGITIIGGMMRIHNPRTIVSHVSLLVGDESPSDCDGVVIDADDVMIDHCTAMWGVDECAGASNPVNRGSFINCIVAEGLYNGPHSDGQHSRGMLFNDSGTDICVMGCLFAHNNRRHPMTRSDVVLVNNYIYNGGWDGELIHFNGGAHPRATSQGIYVEDGPNSASGNPIHLYSADLYYDDVQSDPPGRDVAAGSLDIVDSPPIVPPGLDLVEDSVPASETKAFTMQNAGSRPASRPPAEADLINNRVGDGRGGPVDSQNDVGGYPNSDQTTHSLDVPDTGLLDWIRVHTDRVELGA